MSYLLLLLIGELIPAYTAPFLHDVAEVSRSDATEAIGEKRNYFFTRFQFGHQLLVSSDPPNDYMKKWLTYEHNRYRRMPSERIRAQMCFLRRFYDHVHSLKIFQQIDGQAIQNDFQQKKVPASDMNMLYWSEELAASAQRHADTCDFQHSKGRRNIGENIWAAPFSDYSNAVTLWFNEVHDPQCACNHAYKHCCGHYVQVVWAKTSLVGCGFARCRDVQGLLGRGHRNVFVCHYNPQGNTVFVGRAGQLYPVPAFKWATGSKQRCSDCPPSAPACYQGLCYRPSNQKQYNYGNVTTELTEV